MSYIPKKADIVWLEFDPQAGHEQAGHRPALVLSPESYNSRTGLAIFCPITSHEKGYPFEVKLPKGFKVSGVILSDQIKSLDWKDRKAKFLCRVHQYIFEQVEAKIHSLLD